MKVIIEDEDGEIKRLVEAAIDEMVDTNRGYAQYATARTRGDLERLQNRVKEVEVDMTRLKYALQDEMQAVRLSITNLEER